MARSKVTVKVSVRDRGANKLTRELAKSGDNNVKVGVFGDAANEDHGGVSNVVVATAQEFGTANGLIPQRSFLRAAVDENLNRIRQMQRKIGRDVIKGRRTEKQGLDILGLAVVGMVQARIAGNIPPPLKASTIARKGSTVALIDTGQLRQSIKHDVEITPAGGLR